MFRIKICGITNAEDARAAVAAGADAIGLNFFAGSPRCVSLNQAEQIIAALPSGIVKVGVFVNAGADEVMRTSKQLALDMIQLHGDETPEVVRALRDRPVMRALRVGDDLAAIEEYLSRCAQLASSPAAVLIDASRPGQYGGTGAAVDWDLLARERGRLGGLPLVLAGGLTPDNVAAAIARVRPQAVDTASGVETSPGRKSPALIEAFVDAARKSFDEDN